jgi:hypothetical protein
VIQVNIVAYKLSYVLTDLYEQHFGQGAKSFFDIRHDCDVRHDFA